MNVYFKHYYETSRTMHIFFTIVQVLFAYDLGFFTYKSLRIKIAVKCFYVLQCLLFCIFLLYMTFMKFSLIYVIWNCIYILQYLIFVIIFIFLPSDATVFKFVCVLKLIDFKLRTNDTSLNVDKKVLISIFLIVTYRFTLNTIICLLSHGCMQPVWLFYIFVTIVICQDIALIINGYIFYALYHRLKVFGINLKNANKIHILTTYHHLYKEIVNAAEKFKCAYDSLHMAAIILNVPQVTASHYHAIWFIQHQNRPIWQLLISIENFAIIPTVIAILAPAIFAGKLTAEAEKIKVQLFNKLLVERDESKCREIRRFIRYIEARPLKFTVYKVIPLDANLLSMIFNFCITYLIVMVQLSHLY